MKISVIMIDGSFRENTYGAEYFSQQDFPNEQYEVIWVEFYSEVPEVVASNPKVKVIRLHNERNVTYHSSYCFNEGVKQASGELLVIPDADVIVEPDFLQSVWDCHEHNDKLVAYGYRYNETPAHRLRDNSFEELRTKCKITNPTNYGGCLTVRKKWLSAINGYDKHIYFESGYHANGSDVYTRFRNFGMPIQWDPTLKLYHPLHAFTSEKAPEYNRQRKLINWRSNNLEYLPFDGIDPTRNQSTRGFYASIGIQGK